LKLAENLENQPAWVRFWLDILFVPLFIIGLAPPQKGMTRSYHKEDNRALPCYWGSKSLMFLVRAVVILACLFCLNADRTLGTLFLSLVLLYVGVFMSGVMVCVGSEFSDFRQARRSSKLPPDTKQPSPA
jgi:hypothetical protein